MPASFIVGGAFVALGAALVVGALPITHRLARVLPQWTMSRGDIERLGSTTFLAATIGMLMVVVGLAVIASAVIND